MFERNKKYKYLQFRIYEYLHKIHVLNTLEGKYLN